MPLNFDVIAPLPTVAEQERAQALQRGRKQRQERAAEVRRAQLLEVAWALLKDQGVSGFNMRELGLRAGYTAGVMYGYFASRDDLLHALRLRLLHEVALAVAQVKSPRRAQRAGNPTMLAQASKPEEVDFSDAVNAQQRFLARAEIWWTHLTQDAFALPLLVLRAPERLRGVSSVVKSDQAAADGAVPWTPLEALERATQPCVDDLVAAGWASKAARRLHREAIFMGVGLATLGARSEQWEASSPGSSAAGAFQAALARWLTSGESLAAGGQGAAGIQHDLFAG